MSAAAVPQQQFAQQQQGREVIAAPVASGSKGLPVCLQPLVKWLACQHCPTCDSSCWLWWVLECVQMFPVMRTVVSGTPTPVHGDVGCRWKLYLGQSVSGKDTIVGHVGISMK
jgi:hypothetical protein